MPDKSVLIKSLRAAANRAEATPSSHNWMSTTHCNCGLVAQQILGSSTAVQRVVHEAPKYAGWEGVGEEIKTCSASGLPYREVISRLVEAGFESADFQHLEDLSDKQIRERAGLPEEAIFEDREDRTAFIRYARAWADILEEKALVDLAMGK